MFTFFFLVFVFGIIYYFFFGKGKSSKGWQTPKKDFPNDWREMLKQEVNFYNALAESDKKQFEFKIHEFLLNCKVTGVDTTIETIDKILVAASAIIPIFAFKEWTYANIDEVLIYPSRFNEKFETAGPDRNILGMVGSGYMEGKMILSQQALRHGFKNERDKKNTAIHEFVHLIDKSDGSTDGIPKLILEKQYLIPWLDLINKKIDEIYKGQSDINPYGATNKAEFFSVVSEYFFERPKLLKRNHPELYALLKQVFKR